MRTMGTLLVGFALGAGVVSAGFQGDDRLADAATRDAVTSVKRAIVEGHRTRNRQALDAKLIDRVGYLADAVEEARALAGVKDVRWVMYSRRPQKVENPYSEVTVQSSLGMSSDLDRARQLLGFHLCYLWEPYLLGR